MTRAVTSHDRAEAMRPLLLAGYTVRDAGRSLGLTRNQVQHIARRYNLRAYQGAVSEAKSDAGIRGNLARWG